MKISNETKVGILAIVALTLLIIGFNFLKGKNVFKHSRKLYAVFTNLGSLEKANQVKINGLAIGSVYSFDEKDKDVSGIVVTINLHRNVNIPKNSVAYISSGILGSSSIVIEKGDATEYLKDGDTVNTRLDVGLIGDMTSQVNPTLTKVKEALDSLKVVLSNVNTVFDPNTKGNIQSIIAHLMVTSASLEKIVSDQSGALAQTLNNMNSVTGNLAKNNDTISATLHNVKTATQKFADLNMQDALTSLQSTMDELKKTIQKINSNDGTLGKLMNDKKLYDQVTNNLISLETLTDDLRVHPKRYVNISVFGKKDKSGPLSSPTTKDTIPSGGN